MNSTIDRLRGPIGNLRHKLEQLEDLEDLGGSLTSKTKTLISNWEAFNAHIEMRDRANKLAAAIATPKAVSGKTLTELWDGARLDTLGDPNGDTARQVATDVLNALRNEYATGSATSNYQVAVVQFNQSATELTQALQIVDADLSADDVLRLPPDEQQAYLKQPVLAAALETQLRFLALAAELAGRNDGTRNALISLTIDWSKAHRRRVWEAWDTNGRAGRWAAILKTGATIEAKPIDKIQRFADLAAFETRQQPGTIGIRQVEHDPEDDDYNNRINR